MSKPTPSEVLEYIQDTLQALQYTGGNPVFNSSGVYVSPVIPILQLSQFQTPSCFVVSQGDIYHPEHNQLVKLQLSLVTFVEHVGDGFGQSSILGGNQTANSSLGVGLKEIEGLVSEALRKTTSISGKAINFIAKSRPKPQFVSQNETLIFGYNSLETSWLQAV